MTCDTPSRSALLTSPPSSRSSSSEPRSTTAASHSSSRTSSGELIAEAVAGAEHFGLTEHARLLREASDQLFPDGVPIDHEERFAQWELLDDAADEAIDALDERWYALSDVLEGRLQAYARTHP